MPTENLDTAPLITIVTASLDVADTIGRMCESIENQTTLNIEQKTLKTAPFEHVIIDGESVDQTVEIVTDYAKRMEERGIPVTVISESDNGIYDAMNKGVACARGRYIGFLNADDAYTSECIQTVLTLADEYHPDCIGGVSLIKSADGNYFRPVYPDMITARYPQEMAVQHQSFFVKTDLIRSVGGFDTSFPIAADYDLFLTLIEKARREVSAGGLMQKWVLTDKPLAFFSLGGQSGDPIAAARDYYRVRIVHGWPKIYARLLLLRNGFLGLINR